MFGIAGDAEAAGAVDGQIGLAEDCRIHGRVPLLERIAGAVGYTVFAARGCREEDFVRAAHKDGGAVGIRDLRIVQDDLHLVLIPCLDCEHLILIASGEDIDSGLADRQIVAGGERHGGGGIVLTGSIPLRHKGRG